MRPILDRNPNRRPRLRVLAMITAMSTSLMASASGSETMLADSHEQTARERAVPSAKRRERSGNAARRGESQSTTKQDDAASRGGRSSSPEVPPSLPAPQSNTPPAPAPIPANAPAPAHDASLEAATARVEQMQAVSEAHSREMAEDAQRFQERMRAASTPAERAALQQEFQRDQALKNEALQQRLRALSPE